MTNPINKHNRLKNSLHTQHEFLFISIIINYIRHTKSESKLFIFFLSNTKIFVFKKSFLPSGYRLYKDKTQKVFFITNYNTTIIINIIVQYYNKNEYWVLNRNGIFEV